MSKEDGAFAIKKLIYKMLYFKIIIQMCDDVYEVEQALSIFN